MIYSVWNSPTRRYDYYQSPGEPAHTPDPEHLRGASAVGAAPDEAAWPLPSDAVYVGSGDEPRGQIASKNSVGNGFGNIVKAGALGLAAYGLWRLVKRG